MAGKIDFILPDSDLEPLAKTPLVMGPMQENDCAKTDTGTGMDHGTKLDQNPGTQSANTASAKVVEDRGVRLTREEAREYLLNLLK